MLPNMFRADFGDQHNHYATLIDPRYNEFEVFVEKHNGRICLTKGWQSLRDFYGRIRHCILVQTSFL